MMIAITTGLPPRIDGVGDYALSLARFARINLGIETGFIIGDPTWSGAESVDGFEVNRIRARAKSELSRLLRSAYQNHSIVLLHYSGYGYAPRGCPVWLVRALEEWRAESRDRYLITLFHEVHASGSPWTSTFWLSPLQKSLAARLARLSDQCITSLNLYADLLADLTGKQARVLSLPVFSSIGERELTLPLSERARRLAVFGTRGRREQVYKRSAAQLNRICSRLGIQEIVDIGQPLEFDLAQSFDVKVEVCGEMAGREVSDTLSDAVAGVIDYPAAMLGKSTIFAAYSAHRLIPIVADYGSIKSDDGLKPSIHYWPVNDDAESLNLSEGQVIADNAYVWYQTHSLSDHGKMLTESLNAREYLGSRRVINAKS